MRRGVLMLAVALAVVPRIARAADAVAAGEVRSYATIHSIGVEWDVTGDDNHDATVAVRYRMQGTSAWRDAQPLVRVAAYGGNFLAGSVLFVEPATAYDLELTLADPDGGGAARTLSVTTRGVPRAPVGGRVFHVVPGGGGGDGSAGAPFQGIAAAQAVAQPGDTFLVHVGDYGASEVQLDVGGTPGSYVAWIGAGDGTANFPGHIRVAADHLWLEGLAVENGPISAIVSGNAPNDVVVVRCRFVNNLQAIDINNGGSNWYIADNVIVGNSAPATESFSGEGVELKGGDGHVVAFNSITYVADGISSPGRNCDFYGNDIFDTSDDGIETDGGYANVRVWGNRIHNVAHNGFSFQPQNGAPWYFVRNQLVSYREDALKFRAGNDRFVFAHNTVVNWTGVFNVYADGFAYGISRNNLWISVQGGRMWNIAPAVDWRTDLDYDGFGWAGFATPFKYGGVNLADLAAFVAATGQETHGREVDGAACLDLDYPGPPPTTVPPQVLTLQPGCAAIDVGEALPNLNDGFTGAAPDLGAHEVGMPAPHYGPRPRDTGPPTAPPQLQAFALSDTEVQLAWGAASDDVGVVGYRVYRGGERVGTSLQPGFLDTGLSARTTYTYTVSAYDADWYESPRSNEASATTLGPGERTDGGIPDGAAAGDGGGGGDGGQGHGATGGCGCRIGGRGASGIGLGLGLGLGLGVARRRRPRPR